MKRGATLPYTHADEPQRLLSRLPTVVKLTRPGRSTIYADASFSSPVRLGSRAVAWRWPVLNRWTQTRSATHP